MSIFPLGRITKKLMLLPVLFALGKDKISSAEDTLIPKADSLPTVASSSPAPRVYQVIDHIDDKAKMTVKDAVAFYPVNTKIPFHIVQYKEAGKFGSAYYEKDIEDHNPFPAGASPLAIIEPGNSGLAVGF